MTLEYLLVDGYNITKERRLVFGLGCEVQITRCHESEIWAGATSCSTGVSGRPPG